jgi:hypothetical protein
VLRYSTSIFHKNESDYCNCIVVLPSLERERERETVGGRGRERMEIEVGMGGEEEKEGRKVERKEAEDLVLHCCDTSIER